MDTSWSEIDKVLSGLSIVLLLADIFLIGIFVRKIFFENNNQIFGNKKTTLTLDKVFVLTLILLVLQAIFRINMVFISKNATKGFTCSVHNFIFQSLNTSLKTLTFFIIFMHYYIWAQQRRLRFLRLDNIYFLISKITFAFVLSVSVVVSFKMNIDTAFVTYQGLCYGKTLPFKNTLNSVSLTAAILVVVCLISVQCLYIFKTKQEESRRSKSANNKLGFSLIRRQVYMFLALHLSLLVFLSLFFLKRLIFPSNELEFLKNRGFQVVEFAGVGDFFSHLYNFLCLVALCVFRCKVPVLDVNDEFLKKQTSATLSLDETNV